MFCRTERLLLHFVCPTIFCRHALPNRHARFLARRTPSRSHNYSAHSRAPLCAYDWTAVRGGDAVHNSAVSCAAWRAETMAPLASNVAWAPYLSRLISDNACTVPGTLALGTGHAGGHSVMRVAFRISLNERVRGRALSSGSTEPGEPNSWWATFRR